MAEERQASYVLARRSFCGATKENEGKEKKKENLHSASRFPERAEWVLQQVGRESSRRDLRFRFFSGIIYNTSSVFGWHHQVASARVRNLELADGLNLSCAASPARWCVFCGEIQH